jgi:hypothetical protein
MALVLAGLMHGVPRTEALSPNWEPLQRLRQSEPLHAEVEAVAAGSFRKQSPPAIKGNGYVVKSLEAALWAFHDAEDFRDAVLKAVNLGDDADTTGAVCGQFAGAYWGESGIPTEWLKGLARRDMIEQPLAQLLGDRRQVNVDRATKPAFSVPTLPPPTVRSYWVVENRFLAGAYPGSPDRSQHRQRVEQLWHAGKSDHNVVLHVDRSASTTKGHLAVYGPKRGKQPGALLARPVGWENWELEEDRFKRAEEHRLLYVAATRAGSQMTIVQREAGGSKNHWQFFAQHMDECDDIEDPGLQVAPGGTTVHVDQVAVNEELDKIPGRWQTAQQATYATAAAKEVSVTPSSLHHFGGSGEHDTEWGTVIHFLLEAVMRKPDANLDSLAKMAVAEQELAPDAAPAALQVIKQVTESAVWLRALNSLQRLVEVPFVTQLAADQSAAGLPTVLRGVIDLAFEEEDGWVIVDYKTDLVTGDRLQSLTDHYRGQVNTYASVWQSMLGASVKEKGLYFTSSGQYVTL